MASPTQLTWVWVDSRSWWWTGRPVVLRFMGLKRVGHDWATELNWTEDTKEGITQVSCLHPWTKLFFWTPGHHVCLFTGSFVYPFTYACFKYLSSFDSLLMILWRSVRSSLSSRSRPSRRRRRTCNEASREDDGMRGRARGGTQWRSREFITCCVMWQKKKNRWDPEKCIGT